MSDLLETLRLAADDPMWADHAEVPKKLLRHTVDRIEALEREVAKIEAERDEYRRFAAHWHSQCQIVATVLSLPEPEGTNHAECVRSAFEAIEADKARLSEALRNSPDQRHFDILVEAMAEVKATTDGHSDQSIADIVQGCLDEIAALSPTAALSGSGSGWRDIASAPIGTFLAINAGEIERWDHHDDPGIVTRKSEERAFTCLRLEDGTFVDEFGEAYLSDGRVVDAEDLTADDNVLRLVGWCPLPAAPQQGGV